MIYRLCVRFVVFAFLSLSCSAVCLATTSTWSSAVSGTWNTAGRWTPAGVPNNGSPIGTSYDAVISVIGAPYTVTLNSNVAVDSLTLDSPNATIDHTSGTLNLTNDLVLNAGTYQFNGGTIRGGRISGTGGQVTFQPQGTFDGVTVDRDLTFALGNYADAWIDVRNGLTISNDHVITLTGARYNYEHVDLRLQGNQSIDGSGTIRASGITNNRVFAVGGIVTFGPGITLDTSAGSQLLLGNTNSGLVNQGVIVARNGGYINLGANNWDNRGSLRVTSGSTLVLDGSTTTAGFGSVFNLGGTLRLDMTLNNAGNVFDFDRILGSYEFTNATIVGGSITADDPVTLFPLTSSGNPSLDGVTIDADLIIPNNTLGLRNNVTLNNRRIELREGAAIELFTPQTLGGTGEIVATVLPSSSGSAATIRGSGYTIGPGITIRKSPLVPTDSLAVRVEGDQWINQGTIISDHGDLTLRGTNWRNEGTIRVTGGLVRLEGTYSSESLGDLVVSNADGILSGEMDNVGNTLHIGGTAPDWTLWSTSINGGRIEAAPGYVIQANSSTLVGVTLAGQLLDNHAAYSGDFVLDDATIIVGEPTVASPSLVASGPGSISGTGRIILNGESVPLAGRFALPTNAPILPNGIVVEVGTGVGTVFATNGVPLSNEGVIRVAGANKLLILAFSAATNRGQIRSDSGSTVRAEVPLTNDGQLATGRGVIAATREFTQQSAGELVVEIAGSRRGIDYGVFDGDGLTTFAGTLRIVLPSRYSPKVGSRFDILDWGSRVGEFDNVELPSLPFGRTWDTSALYSLGELRVNGTPPVVSTIGFSNFNEPPLNASSFNPTAAQAELGFVTSSTPSGGVSPTASVQLVGTNRVFTHRSVNATTTFAAIDLANWLEGNVSLDIQVANTTYEAGDFLRVYITDGVQSVNLFNEVGSNGTDGLDNLATAGFRNYSAEIPFDWSTVSLVITSSSNSSAAAERFDFDNIRFTAVAVPEPASLTIMLVGLCVVMVYRRTASKQWWLAVRIGGTAGLLTGVIVSSAATTYGVELQSGDLLVADLGFDTVVQMDPATGNRAIISGLHTGTIGSGPLWNSVRGLGWEPEGTILVSDQPGDVYRVDPETGTRSILSGSTRGSGPQIDTPRDITLNTSGDLFVLNTTATINTNSILRVDRYSGNRTVVSSQTVGSGPFFNEATAIVYDGQDRLYLAGNQQVFRVDVATGDRSVVSSTSVGSGPPMMSLFDITVLDESTLLIAGRLVYGTTVYPSVFTIDIPTGDRTLISNDLRGNGPELRATDGVAVGNDGQVYVSDRLARAVLTVDLTSGDRSVFSSGSNSSHGMTAEGPVIANVTKIEIAREVPIERDVISFGDTWRYTDTGLILGTNWTRLAFDDGSWMAGTAQFGYGDGDEATVVNCGPTAPACNANNRASTHFRKVIAIDDVAEYRGFIGNVLRDDAAAVFVNGVEVFRDASLPAVTTSSTYADTTSGDNEVATFLIDPALFVDGENIIAVEVHQASATSSDLSFDFRLVGLTAPIPEPSTGVLAIMAFGMLLAARAKRCRRNGLAAS